jgi:DNA polymerase-3 subunit gamma/tau
LEIKEIAGQLRVICEAEGVSFDDDALRLLARKADGSMRDGTSLLDQCITSSGGNLTTDSVRDILGLIGQETVFAFMKGIAEGDPTSALKRLSDCVDEGLDIQELCAALLDGFRDLMLLAAPGDLSDLLLRSRDELELMKEMAAGYELPDLVTIVERLCVAAAGLKMAADPRILLESVLVDLSLLDRQVDIRRLIEGLPGGGGGARSAGESPAGLDRKKGPTPAGRRKKAQESGAMRGDGPGNPPARGAANSAPAGKGDAFGVSEPNEPQTSPDGATAPGHDEAPLDMNKLLEMWDGFVTFVRQKKLRLGVCLFSGKIHSFDGTTIALRFARSFGVQKEQVTKPENVRFLKKTMEKYFGRKLDIVCFREGEERDVSLSLQANRVDAESDGLRGVAEEKKPVVKKLLDEFDGEIIRYNPR